MRSIAVRRGLERPLHDAPLPLVADKWPALDDPSGTTDREIPFRKAVINRQEGPGGLRDRVLFTAFYRPQGAEVTSVQRTFRGRTILEALDAPMKTIERQRLSARTSAFGLALLLFISANSALGADAAASVVRIGFLSPSEPGGSSMEAVRQRLHELRNFSRFHFVLSIWFIDFAGDFRHQFVWTDAG